MCRWSMRTSTGLAGSGLPAARRPVARPSPNSIVVTSLVPAYSSCQASPLRILSSSSTVMAWRGSSGSGHSGTGAGTNGSIRPSATSMPTRVWMTDLAIDHDRWGSAGTQPL